MEFTTLEDVIRFAVRREDAAYRLYRNAAEKAPNIATRKMFEELAAEEAGHKEVFSRIDIVEALSTQVEGAADMHLAEYMAELPFREDMTYAEILRFAIKTEENAYQLYLAAARMTGDPKLRRTLEAFANVEKGHRLRLEEIYDERVLTEN